MALEGRRPVMAEGSKVKSRTQRRGEESNNPRSVRSQIDACAMQEAARAAAVESCAAEKEQPCKDRGQKEDMLSSLLFHLSVISDASFPYVERCLIACSLYSLRRHNLRH